MANLELYTDQEVEALLKEEKKITIGSKMYTKMEDGSGG